MQRRVCVCVTRTGVGGGDGEDERLLRLDKGEHHLADLDLNVVRLVAHRHLPKPKATGREKERKGTKINGGDSRVIVKWHTPTANSPSPYAQGVQ